MVSAINLDPREAPLHQFRQVYRALLENLTFPAAPDGTVPHTSVVDRLASLGADAGIAGHGREYGAGGPAAGEHAAPV